MPDARDLGDSVRAALYSGERAYAQQYADGDFSEAHAALRQLVEMARQDEEPWPGRDPMMLPSMLDSFVGKSLDSPGEWHRLAADAQKLVDMVTALRSSHETVLEDGRRWASIATELGNTLNAVVQILEADETYQTLATVNYARGVVDTWKMRRHA